MTDVSSYRNQSIDLQSKSMGWFLHDRDLRHERVNTDNSEFEKLQTGYKLRVFWLNYHGWDIMLIHFQKYFW